MALAITGAICDIIDASLLKLNAYSRSNKNSEDYYIAFDTDDIKLLPSLMSKMTMSETNGQHINQTVSNNEQIVNVMIASSSWFFIIQKGESFFLSMYGDW